MKKATVIALMVSVLMGVAHAQNENVVKCLYAGYLTYTTYDKDLNVQNGTDWRVGGAIELPMKVGIFKAYSIFGDGFSITGYAWNIDRFQVGKIAKPMTYHRAYPVSAGSHFEPPSLAAMPGGGLGVDYLLGVKTNNLRVAVHEDKNENGKSIPEFGASTLLGKTRLSGFTKEGLSGLAASYNSDRLSTNLYGGTDSTITHFLNYYVSEKHAIYSDFNWCPDGIKKYELGWYMDATGYVEQVPLNVLFGAGVVYRDPNVDPTMPELTFNLYIFITKTYDRK